jgi:hypothetical protein
MHFFRTIRSSIWDPAFYRSRLTDGSGAFAYYFKLALLLSVIATLIITASVGPMVYSALKALPAKVTSYYPDDLEITLTDRHIKTNKEEPYALPLPEEFKNNEALQNEPANLVVFDTNATASLAAFAAHSTLIAVFNDAVIVADGENRTRTISLDEFACDQSEPNCSAVLTDAKLASFMEAISPIFSFVIPFMAVGILLGFFIAHTVFLLAILLIALVLLVVLRIMSQGASIPYGRAYRLALVAVTLPLLINTLSMFMAMWGFGIPYAGGFLFTLVTATAIVILNLRANRSEAAPHTPAAPQA